MMRNADYYAYASAVKRRRRRRARVALPELSTGLGAEVYEWLDAAHGVTLETGVSHWIGRKHLCDPRQPVGSAQPAYSATSFNGSPSLTFNGTSSFMAMMSHPFPLDDANMEVWAVLEQNEASGTAGNKFIALIGGTGATNFQVNRFTTNTIRTVANASDSATATGPFSSRHVVRARVRTGEISIQVDEGTPVTAVSNPSVGAGRLIIGANAAMTGAFGNMKLRDMLFTRLLSTDHAAEMHDVLLPRRNL